LPPEEKGLMQVCSCISFDQQISLTVFSWIWLQCKGHLVPHLVPKSIQCCYQSDHCNRLLSPMYEIRSTTPDPNSGLGSDENVHYLALLVSVTASVIILFVMVVCVYLQ
jgi:bone morphogenetic protein receptor type-1B